MTVTKNLFKLPPFLCYEGFMQNVVSFQTIVARSSSVRIRESLPALEPVARCTSYVLGWVKSQLLKTA